MVETWAIRIVPYQSQLGNPGYRSVPNSVLLLELAISPSGVIPQMPRVLGGGS